MTEFWESSFRDKQEMWGFEPAESAITTLELFKNNGINNILIPGFGYGRNAKVFNDNGVNLFFYNSEAVKIEFDSYGLIHAEEINEPTKNNGNRYTQKFWQIVCRKSE